MTRLLATAAVGIHLLIAVLHGNAHEELGVGLNAWQNAFVYIVIAAAPLVAAGLIWTRYARLGWWVLTISMTGSLLFGIYHHYVAVSNDHVSHLPPGDAQGYFRITAALLIPSEAFGIAIGLAGLLRFQTVNSSLDAAGKGGT